MARYSDVDGVWGALTVPPKPLLFRYYLGGPIRVGNQLVKLEEENRGVLTHSVL